MQKHLAGRAFVRSTAALAVTAFAAFAFVAASGSVLGDLDGQLSAARPGATSDGISWRK